jgi:hypothetical protein
MQALFAVHETENMVACESLATVSLRHLRPFQRSAIA